MMSEQELSNWRESGAMDELGKIPRDVTRRVAIQGTSGGIKLLSYGRKYANDFMKLAFPGRFIIAVGLREAADGTVPPEELEYWLTLVDEFHARHPSAGFVMLNCLAPSQWRQWPAHLRFARHQGLTLQDTICLAQIADSYVGVLDVCGLAAHSAGRPGVYVPLEEGEPGDADSASESSLRAQIMVASGHRADIQVALEKLATLSALNRAYQ
jgi:hypothetical protein